MFTEAHAGKGTWTNRIKRHWLLHSVPRLKYHGAAFYLCCWKLDGPIYSRNKSSPSWFYFLTRAQVFGRVEELMSWWGNKSRGSFGAGAVCSLIPGPCGLRKIKVIFKKCQAFCTAAAQRGLLISKEGGRCWNSDPTQVCSVEQGEAPA